ncbi:hypothetical protein [Mycobacterium sp. 94-17]|uniref:hypothetical protein n=1 Tax=Mycobacterium sp. 94-17 TaxID=2986147 RepID=UPI002D1ECAFC|nr:hypothetical protein [Mycobacterium sp. 94-17]MEB4212327.1 AP2 domain-containing protein [Mycobacterium sp. 94-17]
MHREQHYLDQAARMYADYTSGLVITEIAAKWGVSISTVYSRLQRAGLPLTRNDLAGPRQRPGKTRDQKRYEPCGWCKKRTALSELGADRLCDDCAGRHEKSGVVGVTWHEPTGKWRARVKHNGNSIHVGLFSDLAEAEAAVTAKRAALQNYSSSSP